MLKSGYNLLDGLKSKRYCIDRYLHKKSTQNKKTTNSRPETALQRAVSLCCQKSTAQAVPIL